MEELIGPQTVNTLPEATLKAFRDHGVAEVTLTRDVEGAAAHLAALEEAGVSMAEVTAQLEAEGVKAFADSYDALIAALEAKT